MSLVCGFCVERGKARADTASRRLLAAGGERENTGAAGTARCRVPMRRVLADRPVVAGKPCNEGGAKGPAHLWFVRASNQAMFWEETSGQVRSGRETV